MWIKASCSALRLLCIIVITSCWTVCAGEKLRYALKTECDRYSLDALYHERYKPITNNIFADCKEFVSRVSDLLADSMISVMAELPGREASDNQEKRVHAQFKSVKASFGSRVKKSLQNITTAWEDLLVLHFDLMYDNSNATLQLYENKTTRMSESYTAAHHLLDTLLSHFVSFVKKTVGDSLIGVEAVAEYAIKNEEEERKKNQTDESKKESSPEKSKDEALKEKKEEIIKMIVPGFLGKVTLEVVKKGIDLKKAVASKMEDRDNPFDDIEFDMLMIKNRIRAIVKLDVPKDKGDVDLARRSIYTYWADMADEMYRLKIESARTKPQDQPGLTGRLYYRNLWKDEDQILNTLLDLMQVYS